jgi:hypothetical protein
MGGTDDPPSFCRQKGAARVFHTFMTVCECSALFFHTESFISMSVIFHRLFSEVFFDVATRDDFYFRV